MEKVTLLSQEDVLNSPVLNNITTRSGLTDFALLTGGMDSSANYELENGLKPGCYWTKSSNYSGQAYFVNGQGNLNSYKATASFIGIRPVVNGLYTKEYYKSGDINGTYRISVGEYPQTLVSDHLMEELDLALDEDYLNKSGRIFTTELMKISVPGRNRVVKHLVEYEYNGEKYVTFRAKTYNNSCEVSDGRIIKNNSRVWIRVEPITWFANDESDMVVSENILFSGVKLSTESYYTDDFEKNKLNKFLNNQFLREIFLNSDIDLSKNNSSLNQSGLDFTKVSEEEIIKGAVESDIPVFLHGRSSDGKSARVKQLDPDATILYLRNVTPESLNGKSVYNKSTGEMIDIEPTWYKKIKKKCESEPNNLHILFFDELTNALPSIQGMVFNIVLDKEINGIWKLPKNVRIVAAGNELEDSLSAYELAEPLFSRFAHVYINTTADSWIEWALSEDKQTENLEYKEDKSKRFRIHPKIQDYIAFKSQTGNDILRTPYTGEKPNADPRKWEMASKLLYRKNSVWMLRSLIGEELTSDFIAFCTKKTITIDEVLNREYSLQDLDLDLASKYATVIGLTAVTIDNVEIVRDFLDKLGPEMTSLFDSLWAGKDEQRLEKIAELKLK